MSSEQPIFLWNLLANIYIGSQKRTSSNLWIFFIHAIMSCCNKLVLNILQKSCMNILQISCKKMLKELHQSEIQTSVYYTSLLQGWFRSARKIFYRIVYLSFVFFSLKTAIVHVTEIFTLFLFRSLSSGNFSFRVNSCISLNFWYLYGATMISILTYWYNIGERMI